MADRRSIIWVGEKPRNWRKSTQQVFFFTLLPSKINQNTSGYAPNEFRLIFTLHRRLASPSSSGGISVNSSNLRWRTRRPSASASSPPTTTWRRRFQASTSPTAASTVLTRRRFVTPLHLSTCLVSVILLESRFSFFVFRVLSNIAWFWLFIVCESWC